MAKLRFDAKTHTYWIGKTQKPSVSNIVRRLQTNTSYYTQAHALRGTHVHLATRYSDEGTLDRNTLGRGLQGYVRAWERFKEENQFIVIDSERPLYHQELGYAGTPDRYGLYRAEAPAIVDIKSGVRQRWHDVQINGYILLAKQEYELDLIRGIIVYLTKTGTYRMVQAKIKDRNTFLACLTILRWEEK